MTQFVLFNKGQVVAVTEESPFTGTPELKKFEGIEYDSVKTGWEFNSYEEVEDVAKQLTTLTGKLYMASDAGECVSPRYNVFNPPAVGDKVSYTFNGDYYPDGEVVRVTKNYMVVTSTGSKYNRRKLSAGWTKVGGTWGLVKGHIDRLNQEF